MLLSTARASVKSPNGGAAVRQNSFIRSVKNSSSGARMQEDYFLCMAFLLCPLSLLYS